MKVFLFFNPIVILAVACSVLHAEDSRVSDDSHLLGIEDLIFVSENRRFAIRSAMVPVTSVDQTVQYYIAVYKYDEKSRALRMQLSPQVPSEGFKPTFGWVSDDGEAVLIDGYVRGPSGVTTAVFRRSKGGASKSVRLSEILAESDIKDRHQQFGYGVRWLASFKVEGRKLYLTLADRNGAEMSNPKIVVVDIDAMNLESSPK